MIRDIHGCLAPFEGLWDLIDPRPEDHVVFPGDDVVRGPDSRGVIDFILDRQTTFDLTCLSGNHEAKCFLARGDTTELAHLLDASGGGATLESYGPGGWLTGLHMETGVYWQRSPDREHREGMSSQPVEEPDEHRARARWVETRSEGGMSMERYGDDERRRIDAPQPGGCRLSSSTGCQRNSPPDER